MIKHCWQWRNNISLAWNRSPIVRTQNGKSHMLTKAKTWGENRMRGIRFRLLLPMASSLGIWLEKRRWNVDAGFVPVLISHFEVEVGRQGSKHQENRLLLDRSNQVKCPPQSSQSNSHILFQENFVRLETCPLLQNLVGAAGGISEVPFLDFYPELLLGKKPDVGPPGALSALFEK